MSAHHTGPSDESATSAHHAEQSGRDRTTSRWKRAGAAVFGGTLVAAGLKRRSISGAVMALSGGWILYRVHTTGIDDRPARRDVRAVTVSAWTTIGRPAEQLSDAVTDPEYLGRVLGPMGRVVPAGAGHHRWIVTGPFGRTLSWELELVTEQPGERLHWESTGHSTMPIEWTMTFDPASGGRGTVVTFEMQLYPPAGAVGRRVVDRLDILPETVVSTALDRFKSLAETGEVATLEPNPSARGRGDLV